MTPWPQPALLAIPKATLRSIKCIARHMLEIVTTLATTVCIGELFTHKPLLARLDQLLTQFAHQLGIGIGILLFGSADQCAKPFEVPLLDLLDHLGVLRQ